MARPRNPFRHEPFIRKLEEGQDEGLLEPEQLAMVPRGRSQGSPPHKELGVPIDVYCDESRPELFGSRNPQGQYLLIGSIWLAASDRQRCKEGIHALRDKHKVGGEFKWQKVSPSRVEFYRALAQWFVDEGNRLRFRCIAVDRKKVDLPGFHEGDQELGFYKFYYQLLLHWLEPNSQYNIFCDFKSNRVRARLADLQRCLQHRCPRECRIATVQSVRSEESVLVQLVDVLVGAASAKLNWAAAPNSAKAEVITALEGALDRAIQPTAKWEQKFNVFMIEPGGGR